jgi:hypothetical protein
LAAGEILEPLDEASDRSFLSFAGGVDEERLLAGVVVEEEAFGDVGILADGVDAGVLVAVGGNVVDGGAQECVEALFAAVDRQRGRQVDGDAVGACGSLERFADGLFGGGEVDLFEVVNAAQGEQPECAGDEVGALRGGLAGGRAGVVGRPAGAFGAEGGVDDAAKLGFEGCLQEELKRAA